MNPNHEPVQRSDYAERDAAIRYVIMTLGGAYIRNPIIKGVIDCARHHRNYSLTDALCECVKALAAQNKTLLDLECERKLREPPQPFVMDGKLYTPKDDGVEIPVQEFTFSFGGTETATLGAGGDVTMTGVAGTPGETVGDITREVLRERQRHPELWDKDGKAIPATNAEAISGDVTPIFIDAKK